MRVSDTETVAVFAARATTFGRDAVRGFVVRDAGIVVVRVAPCFICAFFDDKTLAPVRADVVADCVMVRFETDRFVFSIVVDEVFFPRIIGVFSSRTAASARLVQIIIDTTKVKNFFISGVNLSKFIKCRASENAIFWIIFL